MGREMRDYSHYEMSPEAEELERKQRSEHHSQRGRSEDELWRARNNIQTGPRRSGSHKKLK